jgi:hypothetical protein
VEQLDARHEPSGGPVIDRDQQVVPLVGQERPRRPGVDRIVEERLGGGNAINIIGSEPLDPHPQYRLSGRCGR